MNYILEEMNKCGAEGVDFVPFSDELINKHYYLCQILESYTKEEFKNNVSYPKTPRLYWKMVNGRKEYCKLK